MSVTSRRPNRLKGCMTREITWEHPTTGREHTLSVVFRVYPGRAEEGPSFACAGGSPAEPAELDIESIHLVSLSGKTMREIEFDDPRIEEYCWDTLDNDRD